MAVVVKAFHSMFPRQRELQEAWRWQTWCCITVHSCACSRCNLCMLLQVCFLTTSKWIQADVLVSSPWKLSVDYYKEKVSESMHHMYFSIQVLCTGLVFKTALLWLLLDVDSFLVVSACLSIHCATCFFSLLPKLDMAEIVWLFLIVFACT